MGVALLEGALRYPAEATPEANAVFARVADWIVNRQERLPDGTFWRPNSTDQSATWPKGTIWADDLYMSCPYLARWAQYTHQPAHLTDAAHQILNMAKRLQDTDGLWFHAYSEVKHEHSPFKWGRANGWVIVATAEVLSAMPENHPDRGALLDVFRRHVAGVKAVQAPSGLWRQVLDHHDIWEETSCSAMFAYAIARGVNRGWLPPDDLAVARKAFTAICAQRITADGAVNGTCEGTNIGLTLDYYANRQRPADDLHGRGVVLLAGTELLSASHEAVR
jgi:rhamnogalacturonyl hydrolase YesR